MMLVDFSGEAKHTIGEIELLVLAEGVNKYTRFCVLEGPSSFNIILGRPLLHEVKSIPTTYYQVIKFQTRMGVKKIGGHQAASKACYAHGLKRHSSAA